MKHPFLMLLLTLAVTACDPNAVTGPAPQPGGQAGGGQTGPATPPAQPLTPGGKGLIVKALPDDTLQYAASVVEVHDLTKQGDVTVKMFGTAGGDPAMNGLQTYLAFYRSPAEGWWVFGVGDFLSFRILNETPGRVDLEVEESVMDPATNAITSHKRRMILSFTATDTVESAPPSVESTPAA